MDAKTASPFFADKVVPLDPAEMEPFYQRDGAIKSHLEKAARIQAVKDEYDRRQDEKISYHEKIVTECNHQMTGLRQKRKAARARITQAKDRKKTSRYNDQIARQFRLIEVAKTRINKRECGKTAKAMTNEIFKKLKQGAADNMKRKIVMPSMPFVMEEGA